MNSVFDTAILGGKYFLNKFHIIAFFTGRYSIKMQDGRIYRFISWTSVFRELKED